MARAPAMLSAMASAGSGGSDAHPRQADIAHAITGARSTRTRRTTTLSFGLTLAYRPPWQVGCAPTRPHERFSPKPAAKAAAEVWQDSCRAALAEKWSRGRLLPGRRHVRAGSPGRLAFAIAEVRAIFDSRRR
jgi:hypothetical protein